MSWTREFHLFLNIDLEPGLVLLRDKTGQAAAPRPEVVAADCFPVNVWLRKRSSVNGEAATAEVIDPTDQMILSAKVAGTGTPLFSATEFALVGEADDRRYRAVMDLNTAPILALFSGSAQAVIVVGEIEIQNAANTERLSAQFDMVIRRQIYAGEGTPTPGTPLYPLPAALALREPDAGTYRVKTDETGSYWQVKHRTSGNWHTVFADGDVGAEYLTIGPAEEPEA